MTEEKTCYNCGNKNCHIFYSAVKQDVAEHHETYEYNVFDCVNHDKWKEMKVEEIRTDNTKTLKNALERIAELEEKTSVLLSCENCPENKDGLICQKEYEGKCLAQKIQYIKELQQENAELKARLNAINQLIPELEKENAELKEQIEKMKCCEMCKHKNLNWEFSPICEARDKIKIENPLTCKCDKWEIKENDR